MSLKRKRGNKGLVPIVDKNDIEHDPEESLLKVQKVRRKKKSNLSKYNHHTTQASNANVKRKDYQQGFGATQNKNENSPTAAVPSTSKNTVKTKDPNTTSRRYSSQFFSRGCEELARKLLGKLLVRKLADGTRLAGIIVETEAYLGGDDKAAHSYGGKQTPKNAAMYMDPGSIYVYHIYGTLTCVNISALGDGAAVLIRGLDPREGHDVMRISRGIKRSDKGQSLKDKDLCSGPSKLTQALKINKDDFNKKSLVDSDTLWLEHEEDIPDDDVIVTSRVGVDYAEDWAKKPLRFYIRSNQNVSVRDKTAEK